MEYKLTRGKRKTISIQITEKGELLVKAPYRLPREEIDRFILSKHSWIEKHLTKIAEIQAYVEKLSMEEIEKLADKALAITPEKCANFARILEVSYGQITIRNQSTRWGSCSSKGNLKKK